MKSALQAYRALARAAEKIGLNNYRRGLYQVTRRRGKVIRGYSISDAHRSLIEMMPRVLSGQASPDEAMSLLHEYDVMRERFPPKEENHD